MGKRCIVVFIMLLSVAIVAHGGEADLFPFLNINHAKLKVTQLQYYLQDILNGPTPSNIVVATANSTRTSPTLFGLVAVLDDPLRTLPNSNASIVGRAQGLIVFSSLSETSIHMTFDLVFTDGRYNGSTLTVAGHNPYLREHRELSVVGGSGVFQMARGSIAVRTVSLDPSGGGFFQYNITVFHY